MKRVAVLMSTYNGSAYIEDQINSILDQENVDITLFVRDDGSIDDTINKIKSFNTERIHLFEGVNCGPAKSFFEVCKLVPLDFDYYAFADQDDYWDRRKLIAAVTILEAAKQTNDLRLYYSAQEYTDGQLNTIGFHKIEKDPGFVFSLVRSVFPGCTMVFNGEVLSRMRQVSEKNMIMHDHLVYQIVRGSGGYVYYDENSYIKYRQHGNNVSDYSKLSVKLLRKRIKEVTTNRNKRKNALNDLLQIGSSYFSEQEKESLALYANYDRLSFVEICKLAFNHPDTIRYRVVLFISMILKVF